MKNKEFGVHDPLVVDSKVFAEVLSGWVEKYRAFTPPNVGINDGTPGAYMSLQEQTGISERHLHRLADGYYSYVSFGMADTILTAIGETHLLQTTLAPMKSPLWKEERFIDYLLQQPPRMFFCKCGKTKKRTSKLCNSCYRESFKLAA